MPFGKGSREESDETVTRERLPSVESGENSCEHRSIFLCSPPFEEGHRLSIFLAFFRDFSSAAQLGIRTLLFIDFFLNLHPEDVFNNGDNLIIAGKHSELLEDNI